MGLPRFLTFPKSLNSVKDLMKVLLSPERRALLSIAARMVIEKALMDAVSRNSSLGARLKIQEYIYGRLGVNKGDDPVKIEARAEIDYQINDAFKNAGKSEQAVEHLTEWVMGRLGL